MNRPNWIRPRREVGKRRRYAVSEPVLAGPYALNHLRAIDPDDEVHLAGLEAFTEALCGRELGWDLGEADAAEVARLAVAPRGDTGGVWLCATCHRRYQEREA